MAKLQTISLSTPLLLEDGSLAANPVARVTGAREFVLSRALCRFRRYRPPHPLRGAQLAKAARLYASVHAPYASTGSLILRTGGGAEIWYWDRAKLAALEPVRQASPESVWRAPFDGWRVVECVEGYEAQCWQGGVLIASTWRRERFSAAQWAAFTLSVPDAPDAPVEAPDPVSAPLNDASWRARRVTEPLGWRDAERAGVFGATCALAVAAVFCGQALKLSETANRAEAHAAAIQQAMAASDDVKRAVAQQRLLRDYMSATQHPAVLPALAEAHETLARFDLRAGAWRVNGDGLSFIVDAAPSDAPVRDIVAAAKAAPHLCDVVPEIASPGHFEIRAKLREPRAACASDARRQ